VGWLEMKRGEGETFSISGEDDASVNLNQLTFTESSLRITDNSVVAEILCNIISQSIRFSNLGYITPLPLLTTNCIATETDAISTKPSKTTNRLKKNCKVSGKMRMIIDSNEKKSGRTVIQLTKVRFSD
jgi:hypothetical protein